MRIRIAFDVGDEERRAITFANGDETRAARRDAVETFIVGAVELALDGALGDYRDRDGQTGGAD